MLSLLPRAFVQRTRWHLDFFGDSAKEGSTRRWINTKDENVLIIELNAQPSFIIFSYIFTPRLAGSCAVRCVVCLGRLAGWLALVINWKDFIIQFFLAPRRREKIISSSFFDISHHASGVSSNLKPFCSVYVCFCSRSLVFFCWPSSERAKVVSEVTNVRKNIF